MNDVDAVAAEIKAKGVEFTREPTTIDRIDAARPRSRAAAVFSDKAARADSRWRRGEFLKGQVLDYGSANPRRTRSLSGMSGMPL